MQRRIVTRIEPGCTWSYLLMLPDSSGQIIIIPETDCWAILGLSENNLPVHHFLHAIGYPPFSVSLWDDQRFWPIPMSPLLWVAPQSFLKFWTAEMCIPVGKLYVTHIEPFTPLGIYRYIYIFHICVSAKSVFPNPTLSHHFTPERPKRPSSHFVRCAIVRQAQYQKNWMNYPKSPESIIISPHSHCHKLGSPHVSPFFRLSHGSEF